MTKEEAVEYAKTMSYSEAVYNALQGRAVPYKKATKIKLDELIRKARKLDNPKDCIYCKEIEQNHLRFECYWIDEDGNTASFQDKEKHIVATMIAEYCPMCGRKIDYRTFEDC